METISRYKTAEDELNEFKREPQNLRRFAESEIALALTHSLKQLRVAHDISIEEFAGRVGRTAAYVTRLEEGGYGRCSLPALRTFARALGYDLDATLSALFTEIPEAQFAHDVGVEPGLDAIFMSPTHARNEPAETPSPQWWDELIHAYESNDVIEAVVSESSKGGLVVNLGGVRGFVPASNLVGHDVESHEDLVGHLLRFEVLDLDRERKSAVLSERDASLGV